MTSLRQVPSKALDKITTGKLTMGVALALAALGFSSSAARAQTYRTYGTGTGAHPMAGVTIKGDFVFGTAL